MCRKRDAGSVKLPNEVMVCLEIFERWQGWQDRVQVQPSFCLPGHTKRWVTSLAVAFVPA
jgi:hypothetical protein